MISTITARMIQKPALQATKTIVCVATFFILFQQHIYGQNLEAFGVDISPFTPQSLIKNIFLGEGVEVTSAQLSVLSQCAFGIATHRQLSTDY